MESIWTRFGIDLDPILKPSPKPRFVCDSQKHPKIELRNRFAKIDSDTAHNKCWTPTRTDLQGTVARREWLNTSENVRTQELLEIETDLKSGTKCRDGIPFLSVSALISAFSRSKRETDERTDIHEILGLTSQ